MGREGVTRIWHVFSVEFYRGGRKAVRRLIVLNGCGGGEASDETWW